MAKNNYWLMVLSVVIVTFVSVGFGGFFVDGSTQTNPILKFIPDAFHTIIGWFIMIGSLIAGTLAIVNSKK